MTAFWVRGSVFSSTIGLPLLILSFFPMPSTRHPSAAEAVLEPWAVGDEYYSADAAAGYGDSWVAGCRWPSLGNRLWVGGEYLLWWTDSITLPPLVTTSQAGTPENVAGQLGQNGTQILLGGSDFGGSINYGARISLGYWLDALACRGLEANYFGFGQRTSNFSADSAEIPILARPVFDTGTNTEAAMLVAYPGLLNGSINVDASAELQGAEFLFRRRLRSSTGEQVLDLLIGYRFVRFDEQLRIGQTSIWTANQGNIIAGTTLTLFDQFATENQFHGGEVGLAYEQTLNNWWLNVSAKLGLGNTRGDIAINGQTTVTVPNGGSANFVGGLLAQQTNLGHYELDSFALLPELQVRLSRELTRRLTFSIGYDLLYWSSLFRLSDQLDRAVSQFPPEPPTGARRPALLLPSSGLLFQGMHLGFQYQF